MTARARLLLAVAGAVVLAAAPGACKPDLGPGDSFVGAPRVLAIKSDPAEAKPGTTVTLTAFVATPDGTRTDAPLAWSFCTAPKPLTVDNVVSTACTSDPASLAPIADGPAVYASVPGDACRLFGPDTPPGNFRPRDPDVTGGYYQPVRADLAGADATFDLLRVTCDLANATADQAAAFAKAYVPNANPHLGPLGATIGGAGLSQAGVPAGARVDLVASWNASDAETYAWLDPASQTVTTKRESMRVAWYASAGAFDSESTGRAEDDLATTTPNGWTAPAEAGTAHLWIVLRDSRGGVDFAGYDLAVVK